MSTSPASGPHFHVGIVVPDLERAQQRFTELLGVTWGPVLAVDAYDARDGAGNDLVVPMKMCYSTDAPHLELIEEIPGTVWVCNEFSNLHHIGVWTDDFLTATGGFAAAGCPMQASGRAGDDAPVQFAYHADDLRVRVELVDDGIRSMMEQFLFVPPAS